MKNYVIYLLLVFGALHAFSWGKNGHRIVGQIAQQHLSKKAKKNIARVLGNETLAEVSNHMDFIRSDSSYDHLAALHYCTIPDGMTYEQAGTPEKGDAVTAIQQFIQQLEAKDFSQYDEAFILKCLVHLIGDIHQPLHVGNGEDKGGNEVKLSFFWEKSNLHRVWDSDIIDHMQYSYTEYAAWINHPTAEEVKTWQSADVLTWVYESMSARDQVYDFPEDKKLSYQYVFKNRDLVNKRLLQAGIRLAGVLNAIYG